MKITEAKVGDKIVFSVELLKDFHEQSYVCVLDEISEVDFQGETVLLLRVKMPGGRDERS